MMKLKVAEVGAALHPSEVIVAVKTLSGTENLVIDRRSLRDASIVVGNPVSSSNDGILVELPRESQSGAWRVWVKQDQLFEIERMRA